MITLQKLAPHAPRLVALVVAGTLIGPGSGTVFAAPAAPTTSVADSALAVYDGGAVYPVEFARAWAGLTPPERPPGDALKSRQAFLESVVNRKLLAREAVRQEFQLTPSESLEMNRSFEAALQNELFAEITRDVPEPSAADLDRFRRQKSMLAEIRIVTFVDRQRAGSWRTRLATGTSLASLDAAIAREGAALAVADTFRFVAAEQIPDTLAQVIWSLRPGQVSEIHEFGGKPTIIILRGYQTRPGVQQALGGSNLRIEYNRRQYDRARERYREELVRDSGREFDEDGMRLLLEAHLRLPPRNDVDSVTGLPLVRPNISIPVISPADTSHALARLRGRTVTIGEYLAYWSRIQRMRDRTSVSVERSRVRSIASRSAPSSCALPANAVSIASRRSSPNVPACAKATRWIITFARRSNPRSR